MIVDGFILSIIFIFIFSFIGAYFFLEDRNSINVILKSFFSSVIIFLVILFFLIIN